MGSCNACVSTEIRQEREANDSIQMKLKSCENSQYFIKKLVLFGPKGSGKKTIMKQLHSIYGPMYSEEDLLSYVDSIHQCIIEMLKSLINHQYDQVSLSAKANSALRSIRSYLAQIEPIEQHQRLTNVKVIDAISTLWNEHWINILPESNPNQAHFIRDIERFAFDSAKYIPTYQDVLLLNSKYSVECVELEYESKDRQYEYNYHRHNYRIVNPIISNSDTNWRKYLNYFQNATAWIFVADLSYYDMEMEPNRKYKLVRAYIGGNDLRNIPNDLVSLIIQFCDLDNYEGRMKEQLKLFERLINSRYGKNMRIFVFLNKKDLFDIKLKSKPLNECFAWKDYDAYEHGSECKYFEILFQRCNRNKKRTVSTHVMTAIDTDSVTNLIYWVNNAVVPQLHW